MAYQPRLSELQDVLPDTLLLLGVDGTILDNHVPVSADLFTLTEPLNGVHFSAALPPKIASSLEQSIELARTHPVPITFEVDTTCHGRERVYEVRLVNRVDNACLAIFRDITLRQRADGMVQQVGRLRLELAFAERAALVGRLTSAFVHEIGQPITAINANADAASRMLAGPSPDLHELRQIQADIIACAERTSGMFDRLRNILGKRHASIGPLDVNQLVEDVTLMVGNELMMRQILLHTNYGARLPVVSGECVELQQVILNLLLNAADAVGCREKPAIVITTSRVNSSVAIDVSDNGSGIAPRDLKRLFEPFFSTKPNGMGMGLAISSEIIRRHGGTIQALNNAGVGAVFRVLLPARAAPDQCAQALRHALPGEPSNDSNAFPQSESAPAESSVAVGDAILRSRKARAEAIGGNLQATINYLRLARLMRDPEACRRSVRHALVTLHTSDHLIQKLTPTLKEQREFSLMRVQILELMAELE